MKGVALSNAFTSVVGPEKLRIYANGSLHLYLRRRHVVGMQSWIERGKKYKFQIEITCQKSDPIICEYDDEAKWKQVLDLLDKGFATWR